MTPVTKNKNSLLNIQKRQEEKERNFFTRSLISILWQSITNMEKRTKTNITTSF